ncbi:MAG: hypothetical protein ABS78_19140 [Phenylobacterium sp. SCN 70-31]|nr:MAG: hypothetical protein ABS78_19140 [Phenylobacterium sp. SCN 70-31]
MTVRAAFLALSWVLESACAASRARELGEALAATSDWGLAHAAAGLRVWTSTHAPLSVEPIDGDRGVLIGATFPMPGAPPCRDLPDATPRQLIAELSRRRWGRYVALVASARGGETWVYRDPSGALPGFAWSLGDGLEVVGSAMTGLPAGVGPRWPLLNWDRIADFVAKPAVCATQVLVDDVIAVQPGEALRLGSTGTSDVVWSPSAFAGNPIDDLGAAADELRARVSACAASLVGGYKRVILEVSGGLDSAIIAGSLHASGRTSRVVEAINIAFGRPESDEQAYATAVAARAGLTLVQRRHEPSALDLSDLEAFAREQRPSANAVDPKWDRDEIERIRETGAEAIISGQGGDAVFMQMAGAGIVADAWRVKGWSVLRDPVLANVARRTRRSVWEVLRSARAEAVGRAPPVEGLWSSLISREVRAATADLKPKWLHEAEHCGLGPGKQLHIHALARFFLNEGPSRRRHEADVLYPLFAQPVLEHALRIPTPALAGSSYDRAFARSVFADRLPECVLNRRAKGIVTVYFARLIANSLGWLRPYLLDGCLAEAGVLDRVRLELALSPEHLIWAAKPSDILWAVSTEAWVRHWQTRVPDSRTAPRRL